MLPEVLYCIGNIVKDHENGLNELDIAIRRNIIILLSEILHFAPYYRLYIEEVSLKHRQSLILQLTLIVCLVDSEVHASIQ